MFFKPVIFTTITICCFTFLPVQAENSSAITQNAASAEAISIGATAVTEGNATQVTNVPQSQSEWLYRNHFNGTSGFASVRYMQNDDSVGGKTCEMTDDFVVPFGESWKVDTIQLAIFWKTQAPDSYLVNIFKDDDFGFPIEPAEYSFTFTADLPAELTLYSLNVNTTTNNLTFTSGIWWISVIGVYDNLALTDTSFLYWNRLDTLLADYGALARDSIGAAYTSYPIGWLMLSGPSPENPENSFKFWLRGTKETAITAPRHKISTRVAAYPNPATEFITFTLDNTKGKQVELYDVMGKLVDKINLKKGVNKVAIKGFKNGVYTYRLVGEAGKLIDHGRFTIL